MAIQTEERRFALRASRRPQLDFSLVSLVRIRQSEGVFCQTHIKMKQSSKTSARKQRQNIRPRGLVDRGTPLLSRVAAAFGPASAEAVIRDVTPRLSSQVQPRIAHPRHLPVLNTPPRERTKVIPQRSTRDEARPTHYNQTTTQHLLYDFDINKYYIFVVLWFSLPKACIIPQWHVNLVGACGP
jgi:hypothetical protein